MTRFWIVAATMSSLVACSTTTGSDSEGGSTGLADDGGPTGAAETTPPSDNTSVPPEDSSDSGPGTGNEAMDGTDEGNDDATGSPSGLRDCDALCGPYEDCDEGVFLSCQSNCAIAPPLDALDAACGAASAAYFECRYSLSCEDAIANHAETLDPDPCADPLASYVDACAAALPARCDGFCDSLIACLQVEDERSALTGCQFECLLYEGHGALTDTEACDAATDTVIECVTTAQCVDMNIAGCEEAFGDYEVACGPRG